MAHDISSAKLLSKCDINYLSDDLLAQIFTLLPFKSTIGCKCVSKRWLELISSPYFKKQFTSLHHSLFKSILMFVTPHEIVLAFLQQSKNHDHVEIPITFPSEMLVKGSVCGCSHGIFLCCDSRYTYGSGYYVYDPLMKKRIPIPPSPAACNENLYAVGFISRPLTNDRSKDRTVTSFSDEPNFRIVIIKSFIRRMFEAELYIFSSGTGQWKQVVMNIPEGFAFAPHWLLSFSHNRSLYFMGRRNIFVMNPYKDHSYTLDYPLGADSMNIMSFGYLGTSCGGLRLGEIGQNELRVWELIEKNNWDMLHRIDIKKKLPEKFCGNYYKRVAGFHPYDGDIVYLHSYADGVFVCNLRTEKFEAVSGYEKVDISPFQIEIADLLPQES
ncbi:F-box protein At5g07610-like [Lathyrus oleraceus]|uniref:F-box protein At5g07610-like n=1 Tax=Pisum sativum TaxID=3888 RepID=UPI0021D30DCF|nr:F-box protein At5g07610-like [Pisum sativum]